MKMNEIEGWQAKLWKRKNDKDFKYLKIYLISIGLSTCCVSIGGAVGGFTTHPVKEYCMKNHTGYY